MDENQEPKTYVRHEGDKRPHHALGKPKPQGRRKGIRHGADKRPFARFPSRIRTGTTNHFALWMMAHEGNAVADRHARRERRLAKYPTLLQQGA